MVIGPNPALRKINTDVQTPPHISNSHTFPSTLTTIYQSGVTPTPLRPNSNLFNLIEGAYTALNHTQPNLTQSCWLCVSAPPPYYEGKALNASFNISPDSSQCLWSQVHKLTLPDVSGQGTCLGQPSNWPSKHKPLCARFHRSFDKGKYIIPPPGTFWACNTGLTPCVATDVFNTSADYCILVNIFPRITYHPGYYLFQASQTDYRSKREPMSLTLAILLGMGVTAGIGTGTSALVLGQQHLRQLQTAIDQDLKEIETSITALQESLTSLSEVVLQNRRGLDLLFLKEGGLCIALKEECCFYADHLGVIKDSMT